MLRFVERAGEMALRLIDPLWRPSWAVDPARTLVAVFAIALGVRLLHVLWLALAGGPASFLESDSGLFLRQIADWTESGGFNECGDSGCTPVTERVPGYHVFLLAISAPVGSSPTGFVVAQAFLDAGTCAVIAAIGSLYGPLVGWRAGLIAALSVNLVLHSALVLGDVLYLALTALGILGLLRFVDAPCLRSAALAGAALGLAVLVRPVGAPIAAAAVVLALCAVFLHRGQLRAVLTGTIVLAVLALPPQLAWMARNAALFGHFQLVSQTGTHALFWVVPLVLRFETGRGHASLAEDMNRKLDEALAQRHEDRRSIDPFVRSDLMMELARQELATIGPAPIAKAWVVGTAARYATPAVVLHPEMRSRNTESFINTEGDSFAVRIADYLKTSDGVYLGVLTIATVVNAAFLLAAFVGLVRLVRRRPLHAGCAVALLLYIALVNGPIVSPKYQLPVMPVLICLAAVGVTPQAGGARRFLPAGGLGAGAARA